MSLSPQALIRGVVSRVLPSANADSNNNDVAVRQWTYGEVATQPVMRKAHVLADEGSYYVCNNNQTGIVPTYSTAFSATTPLITIYNGNTAGKNLYLDYISLTAIAAGANTTTAGVIQTALQIDNINRYTSGGTVLTANIVSPNMAAGATTTGVAIACGAITAASASAAVRSLVGVRTIRPTVSSTVTNVAGDMYYLNFGGVEGAVNGSITVANASIIPVPMPPVVVPFGSTVLLSYWTSGVSAPSAATYAPEIGFWLR